MAGVNKPDYSGIKTGNLEDMIARHEKQGITNTPSYLAAVEELAKRHSKHLNTERTVFHLKKCARENRFTSYEEIANASEAVFSKVHWQMTDHLDYILQICHAQNLPLLTSICVNKKNIKTGKLEEGSLAGFIKGAKRLKYDVVDELEFLKSCQESCFAWGQTS
ncbi:MAG TPA: hypothetical protein VG798_05270 [Rhizomicrobium sp.]|nr:hypothetical protein [Rhizomicrobium sp.]